MWTAMKTTLDLHDALVIEAKALAAKQRSTLTQLVEEGLRLRLQAAKQPAGSDAVKLPVFKGRGGLKPGIDPTSNKSMFAAAGDE
jgi:hypothetical protein